MSIQTYFIKSALLIAASTIVGIYQFDNIMEKVEPCCTEGG